MTKTTLPAERSQIPKSETGPRGIDCRGVFVLCGGDRSGAMGLFPVGCGVGRTGSSFVVRGEFLLAGAALLPNGIQLLRTLASDSGRRTKLRARKPYSRIQSMKMVGNGHCLDDLETTVDSQRSAIVSEGDV